MSSSDSNELKAIKAKLQKMTAKKEGLEKLATPDSMNEAEMTASMITRLLTQHNLSMEDVVAFQVPNDDALGEAICNTTLYGSMARRMHAEWTSHIAHIVANNTSTEFFRTNNPNIWHWFGRKLNRETAVYLFGYLVSTIEYNRDAQYRKLYHKTKTQEAKRALDGWRSGFLIGAINGLRARLYVEQQSVVNGSEKSLVRLVELRAEASSFMEELYPKLQMKQSKAIATKSEQGYRDGLQWAAELPLNQGIKASDKTVPSLPR